MTKKSTEEKLIIKQFRDGSSSFWCNNKHYHLNEQGDIVFIAGGKEEITEVEALKAYCKRNKKVFKERQPSIFEQQEKIYDELIPFGEFKGRNVSEVFLENKKLLSWMLNKYDFAGREKLKEQIKEILKK